MTETEAISSFLAFLQQEIENFEDGEGLSSKSSYVKRVSTLTESAVIDIDLDDYVEGIFRAKSNDEDDDVVEYLQELADIFEGILDE